MKHIADMIANMPLVISREQVLSARMIAISGDFLNITLSIHNITVLQRVIKISRISYAEKQVIKREIPVLLGYVNNNSHKFTISDILVE